MSKKKIKSSVFKHPLLVVVVGGILAGLFNHLSKQPPITIHGGEGGQAIGAGGGGGVAIGVTGTIDVRGGAGGNISGLDGTKGGAPGAGGGGPSMITRGQVVNGVAGLVTGESGEDSGFAGIRAKGGASGKGLLSGGSGGQIVYRSMTLSSGTYKVVVGRGGKGLSVINSSGTIVGKGGDGAPGIVVIRYRTDRSSSPVKAVR
ncbi:MAG: hypothetical protein A2020_14785 [Lentisphaerae bacterium GWF2_45_14]|nr:MAG: hypothetical protein A2020_14785 [Lentisphaerae bacterium GWF2_45_14]